MNLQNLQVQELTIQEEREIEGGAWPLVLLAAVVVVAVVALGVGIYNGYHAAARDAE